MYGIYNEMQDIVVRGGELLGAMAREGRGDRSVEARTV